MDIVHPDIFIHTWRYIKSQEQPHFDIEGSWRYPDEGSVEDFINLYQPRSYAIEPFGEEQEKKFYNAKYEKNKHPHASISRYLCMLYKIYECHKMCINYATLNNFKYDLIIKARSDIELSRSFDLKDAEKAIKERVLFSDVVLSNGLVSDILFFGNPEVMETVANLHLGLETHFDEGIQFNTEKILPHHLNDHRITPVTHAIGQVKVLRPAQATWK